MNRYQLQEDEDFSSPRFKQKQDYSDPCVNDCQNPFSEDSEDFDNYCQSKCKHFYEMFIK